MKRYPTAAEVETQHGPLFQKGVDVATAIRLAEPVERNLADTVLLVWRERRFVVRAVLWCAIIAAIIALIIPPSYESTTRISPGDNQTSSMLAAMAMRASPGLASTAGDLLGLKSNDAFFLAVLKSRTIEDDLINRYDLRKVYWVKYMRDARKALERRTIIEQDRKSGVISITVSDRRPDRAAILARGYVEELNRIMAQLNTSAAHRERVFIEGRLRSAKQELDDAQREFSIFSSQNNAIDIKEQGRAMVSAGATLQGELIAALSQLEALEQIYTSDNIRVRSARARTEELRRQLEKLGGVDVASSPGQPKSSAPKALYPSLRELPLLGVQYADYYRRTKIAETVYELLTQQYELASIEEAKELPTVRILDPADIPEKKTSPKRTLIVLISAGAAFMFAVTFIVAKNIWDTTDESGSSKALLTRVYREVKADVPVRWADRVPFRNTRRLKQPDGNGTPGDE